MEVKKGYKQTELGIIPEDWEVKKLDLICDVRDGTHESPRYVKEGIDFITSKNIVNGKIDYKNITHISKDDAEEINKRSKVDKGDILMSMIGTIGNSVLINYEPNFCIKNVALIKPLKVKEDYLIQLLYSQLYQAYIRNKLEGGIQKFISLDILRNLYIPLPSTTEQTAIANALSDIDALVESLEKLITKKRNIKQGAMQQLLTGKKRLPGFRKEWKVKKLGEILTYEQPTIYLVKSTEYDDNNDIAVLTANKSFILGYTNEMDGVFNNFPVIIFDDFTTASKFVNFPFKVKSSALKILKLKDMFYDLRFIFEKMQLIQFPIGDHKRYWISEYQNIRINIPSDEEQTAIAEVLSDMESEIEALEKKLNKYKKVKQGMMQELLTGKKRLI